MRDDRCPDYVGGGGQQLGAVRLVGGGGPGHLEERSLGTRRSLVVAGWRRNLSHLLKPLASASLQCNLKTDLAS